MNSVEKDLLDEGIRKYRLGEYSEAEFHNTFETVIGLLTESDLSVFREKFEVIEAELEKIDFLSSNKRADYLIKIERIEQLLLLDIDR